jgi:hypothetical protein
MANDWILDVIEDLRRFADMNDLPQLSRQLEQTACVATRELDRDRHYVPMGATADAGIGGAISGRFATGQDA